MNAYRDAVGFRGTSDEEKMEKWPLVVVGLGDFLGDEILPSYRVYRGLPSLKLT